MRWAAVTSLAAVALVAGLSPRDQAASQAIDTGTGTATATQTATPTPTARPTVTPVPRTAFRIDRVVAEAKGSGLDWTFRRPPLRLATIGQTVRIAYYATLDSGPDPSHESDYFDVSSHGAVLDWWSRPGMEHPGDDWAGYHLFTPPEVGHYTIHAAVTVNGIRKEGWGSFDIVPPYAPGLHISPTAVHVGNAVHIWVTSPYWPNAASVSASLKSAHHAWGGPLGWNTSCKCFAAHPVLAREQHGRENAQVIVRAIMKGRSTWLHGSLVVIGLPPPPKPTATPVPRPTQAPLPPSLVNIQGSGSHTTQYFTPDGSEWYIAYAFDCSNFGVAGNMIIEVYDANGSYVDLAANSIEYSGNDVTYEHAAGAFYLKITSECEWHVVVGNS